MNYDFLFEKKKSGAVVGHCDSDWAGSLDDAKSIGGYCFSFRSATLS